jgi:hypothetical protein
MLMTALSCSAIDVDNRHYEPLDAFTRHLDKNFRRRGVQIVQQGEDLTTIIDNRFIPDPTCEADVREIAGIGVLR